MASSSWLPKADDLLFEGVKELSFNKFPVCPRSPFTLSLSKGRATGLRQAQPERILG